MNLALAILLALQAQTDPNPPAGRDNPQPQEAQPAPAAHEQDQAAPPAAPQEGQEGEAEAANNDTIFIPVPVLMFSENEGASYGAGLAIIPGTTEEGEISEFYIPSYFYNTDTHHNFYISHFHSEGEYQHYEFGAYAATRRDWFLRGNFEDLKLDWGWLDGVELSFDHSVEGRAFFYGFGNDSEDDVAPNYTSQDTEFEAIGYWNLDGEDFRLQAGPIYNDYMVHTGSADLSNEIVPLDQEFPGLQGRQHGSGYAGARLGVVYDTRDIELVPREGSYLEAHVDLNGKVRDAGPDFFPRFEFEAAHYHPFNEDMSIAGRAIFEGIPRDDNSPFYIQPEAGGLADLRGFDEGRFRDFFKWAVNFELRYRVVQFKVGVPLELEIGPFLDIGTVFNDGSDMFERVNVNPGFAARLLNRPNISMGLFVAYGREGVEVHFGFGLPF